MGRAAWAWFGPSEAHFEPPGRQAGLPEPTVEIDAQDLKKDMMTKRKKGISEADFEEIWAAAIGDVQAMDEVTSVTDG